MILFGIKTLPDLATNSSFSVAGDRGGSGHEGPAGLQLSQEAVADFGGVTQLVVHFGAAPAPEACRNMLAVLLDQAAYRLTQVCCCWWQCQGSASNDAHTSHCAAFDTEALAYLIACCLYMLYVRI